MAVWVECKTTKWPLHDTISCRFGSDMYLITGARHMKYGIEIRRRHVRRLYTVNNYRPEGVMKF